jgi:hypothetical protein
MRFPIVLSLILLLPFPTLATAADLNGYTAQYECRAGSPNCNVDVESLVAQPCQQTITTADSLSTINSKINGGSQFVCVQAGDYSGKGTITVTASGSSSGRKVLRYAGPDAGDPWVQSNRAKLNALLLDGADFWIIHRLAFEATSGMESRIFLQNAANDNILSRLLIEGAPYGSTPVYTAVGSGWVGSASHRLTVQNSVIRENWGQSGRNCVGIALESGSDHRIVSNEIANWCEHSVQIGHNGGPTVPGVVIEANDIYSTPSFSGYSEDLVTLKASSVAGNPMRIVNNRIWGSRRGSSSKCCEGGGGAAISYSSDVSFSHILIKNNILFDNVHGITWWSSGNPHTNQSVVGNIFYKLAKNGGAYSSAMELISAQKTEIYLNTVIEATDRTIDYGGSDTDVRCNVMIASGRREGSTPPSSYKADYNAFFGTQALSFNATNTNIDRPFAVRQNNTTYSAGDMMSLGTASSCVSQNDGACYMYVATNAGTSGSSTPAACKTLGCTFGDGGVTWRAIRGPYTFYRKLRTAPEAYTIAYARPYADAGSPQASTPEAYACPSSFAARAGIGIDDSN